MTSTTTLTVGQEVGIRSGGYRAVQFGYTVTKITKTGQVTVSIPTQDGGVHLRRFDADGKEMGTGLSRWHRAELVTDLDAAREQERQHKARVDAARAIEAVRAECGTGYSKESMQQLITKLEAKLAAAKAAVDAI